MKTYVILFAFLILALISPSDAVADQVYQARSLETPTGQSSEARTINNSGVAAGAIDYGIGGAPLPAGPCKQAIVWDGSNTYTAVPEHESWAYASNDMGSFAGWFFDDLNYSHFFLWNSAIGMSDLGRFNGDVNGMNSEGQIVGLLCDPLAQSTAFIWSQETGFTGLVGLDAWWSVAYGINNTSQVVGCASNSYDDCYAFMWSVNEDVTIIVQHAEARAVNDNGQVVGLMESGDMFVWTVTQGLTTIALPVGYDRILPTAINNDGIIVGCVSTNSIGKAFAWSTDTGFTILGEGMAFDVNDSGQIAGRLLLSHNTEGSDTYQAIVWEPVPEPSSILVLIGGLASVVGFALKRRSA